MFKKRRKTSSDSTMSGYSNILSIIAFPFLHDIHIIRTHTHTHIHTMTKEQTLEFRAWQVCYSKTFFLNTNTLISQNTKSSLKKKGAMSFFSGSTHHEISRSMRCLNHSLRLDQMKWVGGLFSVQVWSRWTAPLSLHSQSSPQIKELRLKFIRGYYKPF